MYLINYRHYDCAVDPDVEWTDTWSCACNGECPACGIDDIEPVDWVEIEPIELEDEQDENRRD